MTAPITATGALYVAPSPFFAGGFEPDTELGASPNILIENTRKRASPGDESGQPDESVGKSKLAKVPVGMINQLADWRQSRGIGQTAQAVAAAAVAARGLPGNGRTWEEINTMWDNDENDRETIKIGAHTFPIYLDNCYTIPVRSELLNRFDPVWNLPEESVPLQSENTEYQFASHRGRGEHRPTCYLEMAEIEVIADMMRIRLDKQWARRNKHLLKKCGTYLVRLLRHDGNRPANSTNPLTGMRGMGLHCDMSGWHFVDDRLKHINSRGPERRSSLNRHD